MVDPGRPYLFFAEKEPSDQGGVDNIATIFLTNKECPFRCLMCDLWKNTTERTIEIGQIPTQIRYALDRLPDANQIKLYNSGNFFDVRAIPKEDYGEIADLVSGFETVTVECHPKLIGQRCLDFVRLINTQLEVAIGLETANPKILPLLNKQMDLDMFRHSIEFLRDHGIRSRAFILLKTPFMQEDEGIEWAKKSIDFAFDSGVDTCVIIPTRPGNGIMEHFQEFGLFVKPKLSSLEEVLEYGMGLRRGKVLADIWDLKIFSSCDQCFQARKDRLHSMNLSQDIIKPITCECV